MRTLFPLVIAATISLCAGAQAEEMAPVALNSLSSVPQNIAAAQVFDQRGRVIGEVEKVVTDASGKPAAISITNSQKQLMVVAAPAASYDEARNIVVADTASAQIALR